MNASTDEAQIRQFIDDWRSALCARDLDRLMQHYAPGVVFFDAVPPCQHRGADAYRRTWEVMFDFLPPRLGSEVRDIAITVSGDLAVIHCLQRLINADTGEAATCGWVRVTVCYRRASTLPGASSTNTSPSLSIRRPLKPPSSANCRARRI